MAATQSFKQQQLEVDAKVDRFNDPAPKPEATSWDEAALIWRDIKKNTTDVARGSVAGTLGAPLDLLAMASWAGYAGLNWLQNDTFESDISFDLPGGSRSIGKAIGADIDSASFLAGNFVSPGGLVKGAVTGAKVLGVAGAVKGMVLGAATQTRALTRTLESARGMARLGTSKHKVWQETGWYDNAVEGATEPNWQYVLSDADSVVDTSKIVDLAKAENLTDGGEGLITATVGEVFQHPTLFDAYPQLRDVPIDIYVTRIADTAESRPMFKIFNKGIADEGVEAALATRRSTGEQRLHLFNDANDDAGRSAILHEVQHLVQTIEGWQGGAASSTFKKLLTDAQGSRLMRTMVDDLVSGKVNPLGGLEHNMQYVDDLAKQTKGDAEAIGELFANVANQRGDVDFVASVRARAATSERDVRMMIEEMGDFLDVDKAVEDIVTTSSYDFMETLARSRYFRTGGEVQARLTQRLRDVRQEALQAMETFPSGDVTPARQIQ